MYIIHTNDLHSRFEAFSRIASMIGDYDKEDCLILDAGDFADFANLSLYGTDGKMACDLLACAGYDAWTVGNNEIFRGKEVFKTMLSYTKVPMLSANLKEVEGQDMEGLQDGIIINKKNKRYLVIGLSPDLGEFIPLMGFSLLDNKTAVEKTLQKYAGQYDYALLLTHIGQQKDRALLREIKGIDFLVGGHTHHLYETLQYEGNVPMDMSGMFGEYMGVVDWDFEGKKCRSHRQRSSAEGQISEEIQGILKKGKKEAIQNLSIPMAEISINLWHDVIEENPMTNFIADALRTYTKKDYAVINSGIAMGGFKKGVVTEKKILEISPSPLNVTCFDILVKDLKEALKEALDSEVCLADGRGPGFRGKHAGRLHVSGMKIVLKKENIVILGKQDEILQENETISIATSDYLQRGSGYPSMARNQNEVYDDLYIRDIIRQYIGDEDMLSQSFVWRFIHKAD